MAIQKTATVGNRLVLLSAFVHLSQFHQSQPYIKLCNMMNLRFFGENHKNLLTFTFVKFMQKNSRQKPKCVIYLRCSARAEPLI